MLIHNVRELQATIIASTPLFLCGIEASFAADLRNVIQNRSLTMVEASVVGSINLYARALGSIATGYVVNKLGRKNSILISLFLSLIGWTIISFFSFPVEMIYIGRVCSGLACGLRAVTILYISEVAHKNRRGKLLAFCQLSTAVGVGFSYLVQYFFAPKMVAICALIISLFGFIQACFLHETKYWLLMKSRFEEAQLSMLWFDDTMTVKDALVEIEEIQLQQNEAIQERKCFTIFERWLFVKHLIICTLYFSCRTASGRTPILVHPHKYYKFFILPISVEMTTLLQGILEMVFALANLVVADAFPRKSMLQMVYWTMISCLSVSYFQDSLVEMLGIFGECINLMSLMLYISLACSFLLNLTMITVTEIASTVTEARGIILSVCQVCHNIMDGIYTSVFLSVLASVPVNYVLLFMFANLVILSLLSTLVPETVGKALHKCDWTEEKEQKKNLLAETGEESLQK